MSSDRASGPDPEPGLEPEHGLETEDDLEPEHDLEAELADELARFPRLDAEGMVAEDRAEQQAPAPLEGPSPLLPALVAAAGAVLTVLAVVETIRTVPAAGQARPMSALVLAAALALGGYSLTRVLQLLLMAQSRGRRRAAGEELPEVRRQLIDAHSLHAVWVIGVGSSIALMGLLGVWSLLDGRPSGLEPGWPLLLSGGAVALLAHLARQRTSQGWEQAGDVD